MLATFPAFYLYPLNADSLVKHINLKRVKIGRQTNHCSAENNGYFDSQALSQQDAEVLGEGGNVSNIVRFPITCLKDVKSSNGTFINCERLSPKGLESEPYELRSDDIVVRSIL